MPTEIFEGITAGTRINVINGFAVNKCNAIRSVGLCACCFNSLLWKIHGSSDLTFGRIINVIVNLNYYFV